MRSILVIDDKDDVRSFISMALTSFGFNIRQAHDGDTAIQMIVEEKPDLIICDVNMPGMDGYEILSAVRASSVTAAIPFILMTGLISPNGFRRAMIAGADDYLVKPFSPDDLVDSVMSRLVRRVDFQVEAEQRARKTFEFVRPKLPAFSADALAATV
ncbi:MAG TPA: response regulator [Verrucomicrobiae bacterium]|jgi:CheY-like chemotaxis protein|nr:response regulator [Verrucomicrobiae bacterium]